MIMIGYCYQIGALPLSAEAIEKAIELNGEEVEMNLAAFRLGRRAAADPAVLEKLMKPAPEADNDALKLSRSFAETVDRRAEFLTAYQNASYAQSLPQLGRKSTCRGSRKGSRSMRASGGGGALSVQADGVQGRI